MMPRGTARPDRALSPPCDADFPFGFPFGGVFGSFGCKREPKKVLSGFRRAPASAPRRRLARRSIHCNAGEACSACRMSRHNPSISDLLLLDVRRASGLNCSPLAGVDSSVIEPDFPFAPSPLVGRVRRTLRPIWFVTVSALSGQGLLRSHTSLP